MAGVGSGVGVFVGANVGAGVGSGVGVRVGANVGAGVGSGVGVFVGAMVGVGVGSGVTPGCAVTVGLGTASADGVGLGVSEHPVSSMARSTAPAPSKPSAMDFDIITLLGARSDATVASIGFYANVAVFEEIFHRCRTGRHIFQPDLQFKVHPSPGAYTSRVKEPSGTAIAKAPSSPVMAFPLLSTLPAHAHSPIPSSGRLFGPITLP